jgi:endonuclease/exonuclease/phosphatase (EEP) superfamily protein YafD
MPIARTLLGILGLALAGGCAALGLLAQGGRFSVQLDVLTHFAPLYLVGAAVGGVLALAGVGTLRRAGQVAALVAALAASALMAPEFLRDAGPTAPPGSPGEIKVIQVNAWWDNPHPERIAAWLKAENPDIVLMEEVRPAVRKLIVAQTGLEVIGIRTTAHIYSRLPYLGMHRPPLTEQILTFVNGTYSAGGQPMEVVVARAVWPTSRKSGPQGPFLRQVVSMLPRERMVMGGDFNSTPWSFQRQRDDRLMGLTRRDRAVATWPTGHSGLWSWPAPFPLLPIDHIYAGPGWATTGVRRGPRLGSDHYPLIVTLAPVVRP